MATDHTFPDTAAKNAAAEFETEKMSLSMGPSHPSTHGVLRVQMEIDGETVLKADPVVGYLHRGDEKIAENMTYNQFVPYTDRLDYLAPLANNVAYAIAVERSGAAADRCLFVDDRQENVDAAVRLGMTGVLYREPTDLLTALAPLTFA